MDEQIRSSIDDGDFDDTSIDVSLSNLHLIKTSTDRPPHIFGDLYYLQNLRHETMYAPVTRIEGVA